MSSLVSNAWSDQSTTVITKYTRKTIVANPIDSPVKLDGILNETSWNTVNPVTDFVQTEPSEGGTPTVRTEVRILYDENNLYIGVICFDKEPDKITHNELMRDGSVLLDDYFVVGLDTYNDKRTAYYFGVNPNGAMIDGLINGVNSLNNNWDGVWDCSARIMGVGWSVEIQIPFKILRFYNSEVQAWGINFERVIQRYNEQIFWTGWKRNDKLSQVSCFGALAGIKNIRKGRHIEVKPYMLAGRESSENTSENTLKYGVDMMYGIMSNLTLDLTTHTDFAQIEVDEEIINIGVFTLVGSILYIVP